jgi:hypothetical protein
MLAKRSSWPGCLSTMRARTSTWRPGSRCWRVGAGHKIFLDRNLEDGIRVGEDWQERLHERLRWADAAICLVSRASIASAWCVCEVSTAMALGSRPLQVERGVRHPLLSRLQHESADGDDADDARTRLVAQLRLVDAQGGSGWSDDRSPFPGLRPFDADQHQVFFASDCSPASTVSRSTNSSGYCWSATASPPTRPKRG